jgi:hypothetical protein
MNLKQISLKEHWCSYCSHQKLCENRVQNIYMCKNNEYKDFEI